MLYIIDKRIYVVRAKNKGTMFLLCQRTRNVIRLVKQGYFQT